MTESTCAWCGEPIDGVEDSHGICESCLRRYFPEYADAVLEDDGFERAADCVSGRSWYAPVVRALKRVGKVKPFSTVTREDVEREIGEMKKGLEK